jgi:predicted nuclease of restriction endonuclease-like (RecB) superfamily
MPKGNLGTPKSGTERGSRGRTREGALFTSAPTKLGLPTRYASTLQDINKPLRSARVRAVLAANPIVIEAYCHTGKIILQRQSEAGWGAKVIDRLASDLREEFPDMGGLSAQNLLEMKTFPRDFPGGLITQQLVAQLPWGHSIRFLQRARDPAAFQSEPKRGIRIQQERHLTFIELQNQLSDYAAMEKSFRASGKIQAMARNPEKKKPRRLSAASDRGRDSGVHVTEQRGMLA